jgi:hypothetical protein
MNQYLILESSPLFLLLCLLAGVGYAFLLYSSKYQWSKLFNNILFVLRATLVSTLAFLLLGPIIKQTNNLFEKPVFVIIEDNSGSIKETTDSSTLRTIQKNLIATRNALTEKGYNVKTTNLSGEEVTGIQYTEATSDLNAAIKKISNRYEGKNIAGVILVTDGIYNAGLSPLYASYNFPIHTVGVGDTSQRVDLSVKNIQYNKLAYQGNKFPIRVEVSVKGLPTENVTVSIGKHGKTLDKQTKNSGNSQLLSYDFQLLAEEQGIQKIDIQVEVNAKEYNVKNNRASIFVEIVEGRKKILLVAPFPHPDIKAFQEVVDKNSNYEFLLHIPELVEQPSTVLRTDKIDLAIFLQAPDQRGKTRDLFQQFASSKTSLLLALGQQSDLLQLMRANMPIRFSSLPNDYDDVTPSINSAFSNFSIAAESNSIISEYPPVSVHFGKIQIPLSATPLLYQRVGSVVTDKPLLSVETQDSRKIGLLLGESIWRWRMNEYDRTENTTAFDELFGKLIQYLSTVDDKRKFRSYPLQQQFSDVEPAVFESQVYNDIFEPIYGNTIVIDITDEAGKKSQYSYVTNPSNTRYQIGGLKEGIYHYKAKTTLNGHQEEVKGEFIVVASQAELQNLTADFGLLKKISNNTGGLFYPAQQLPDLTTQLQKTEAKSIIHSEEQYNSLINLKLLFWLFVILVSAEWFLRKYFGSY